MCMKVTALVKLLNNMKLLLAIAAVAEGALVGLALAIIPSLLVSILLGTSLTDRAQS